MTALASAEELFQVLQKTIETANQDEKIRQRLARANTALGLKIQDLGAECTLSFKQGQITLETGDASQAPVRVSMNSDVLDQILSGQLGGESAYYSGKLHLYGDEWLAQTLAGYIFYLRDAYKAARAS